MLEPIVAHDGRRIRLPAPQRLHIGYFHPEVLVDEAKIRQTVSEPDLVTEGANPDTPVSYRFFTDTAVTTKYLAVVVKVLNDEGFIVTSYFTDRIKRRKVVWRRAN